jgi:hypothetical protein
MLRNFHRWDSVENFNAKIFKLRCLMERAACEGGPMKSTCYQSRQWVVDCAERPVIRSSNFNRAINVFFIITLNIGCWAGDPAVRSCSHAICGHVLMRQRLVSGDWNKRELAFNGDYLMMAKEIWSEEFRRNHSRLIWRYYTAWRIWGKAPRNLG